MRKIKCDEVLNKRDFPGLTDSDFVKQVIRYCLDKMNEYYSTYGVNIHRGVYSLSYQATDEYDKARQIVAEFINSDFKEVVFTKNVIDKMYVYLDKLEESNKIKTIDDPTLQIYTNQDKDPNPRWLVIR